MRKVHFNRYAGSMFGKAGMVLPLCTTKWSIRVIVTNQVNEVTCSHCGKIIGAAWTEDMKLDKGCGYD